MADHIRVIHIIPGLAKGGAETMLYNILQNRTSEAPEYIVISLGRSSYYEDKINASGIPLEVFDILHHPLLTMHSIRKMISSEDVVCGWMYMGCIVASLCGRGKVKRTIWCIRHANLEKHLNNHFTRIMAWICAKLSRRTNQILYNGQRSMMAHVTRGFAERKGEVVENGCDISRYSFDEKKRENTRSELRIEKDQVMILSITRDHPIKDVPTYIKAIGEAKKHNPQVIAVICGAGIDSDNERIEALCRAEGLQVGIDLQLLGFRDDVDRLLCASDIYVLHSAGEAFPNGLLQAMACERLCITTDVGDARDILGDDCWVVTPGDYKAIAVLINQMLRLSPEEKARRMKANRDRVTERYNILDVVKKYEDCFMSLTPRRTLYIGGFEVPDRNAASHRVMGIAKSMRECGMNVILCGIHKEDHNEIECQNIQGFDAFSRKYPVRFVEWIRYLYDISFFINLSDKYRIDSMICYNLSSITLGRLSRYCRREGIRCMADVTEWYGYDGRGLISLLKMVDEFFRMRIIQKKLNGLIVISSHLEEYYGGGPSVVRIPPTVDIQESKWSYCDNDQAQTLSLVFTTDAVIRDGLEILIRALLKVRRSYSLDVIGLSCEDFVCRFPQYKKDLDDNESIRFHGRLSHDKTIGYIREADFLCFFRKTTRQTKHGFPSKYVEAVSCGTPVITNATSDIEEYAYGNAAILVDSLDENAIIETIEHAERRSVVDRDRFDYRKYTPKLYQFFAE